MEGDLKMWVGEGGGGDEYWGEKGEEEKSGRGEEIIERRGEKRKEDEERNIEWLF